MLKEIRKLAKTNRPKANYIRALQNRGLIKRLVSEKGYVAYDPDELKEYQANVHWGRPLKKDK